jgi:transcriptional regulator with XRE-family HTH domain
MGMKTNLRNWRIEKGLTLDALAASISASKSMVSKWERGTAIPRRQSMQKILEVTEGQVTAESFFESGANA